MAAGRNLLQEREGIIKMQGASIYILGWAALLLGVTAGSYAANSWPGKTIRWVFELFPAGVTQVVLVLGFAAWVLDILNDLTPNQVAVTYAFLGPILAASKDATGTLAVRITEWSTQLQHGVGGQMSGFVGNVGAGLLAVALMGMAVIIGKRVLQKQATAAAAARGGAR